MQYRCDDRRPTNEEIKERAAALATEAIAMLEKRARLQFEIELIERIQRIWLLAAGVTPQTTDEETKVLLALLRDCQAMPENHDARCNLEHGIVALLSKSGDPSKPGSSPAPLPVSPSGEPTPLAGAAEAPLG